MTPRPVIKTPRPVIKTCWFSIEVEHAPTTTYSRVDGIAKRKLREGYRFAEARLVERQYAVMTLRNGRIVSVIHFEIDPLEVW